MSRINLIAGLCFLLSFGTFLFGQTESHAMFDRYVIPRTRSTPALHYWSGVDDENNGIVVLVPKSPEPNGYGLIWMDSAGFVSHHDSYWSGGAVLNLFQRYLRKGYTVFIVTHPPTALVVPDDHNTNGVPLCNQAGFSSSHPGYISAEIREFVEESVLEIKKWCVNNTAGLAAPSGWTGNQFPISDPHLPMSWGAIGASSAAYLALDVALTKNEDRKTALLPVPGLSGLTPVDTAIGAATVESPGVDVYNWRVLGDTSYVRRNAALYVHADLTCLGYPTPSVLGLPTHLDVNKQIVFPSSTSSLLTKWINGDADARFFPEIYLELRAGVTVNQGLERQVNSSAFSSLLSFQTPVFGDDEATARNNEDSISPLYGYLPSAWADLFVGFQIADKIGANFPQNDPPILYMYGDCDSVVSPYQPTRYKQIHDNIFPAAPFDRLIARGGEKHGYRDMDKKDRGEYACFFDEHLRGIVDMDRDGLDDANEPPQIPGSPMADIDGDGQLDGNEYAHAGLAGVHSGVNEVTDPSKTFKFTSLTKELKSIAAPYDYWEITAKFNGKLGNSYVVQACDWLFSDEGDAFQVYPEWKVIPGIQVLPPAQGQPTNEFTVSFLRKVDSANTEKYIRIALVLNSGKFHSVTTAPVGIEKGLIRRNQGGSLAVSNFICSPFHNPDERRVLLNSAPTQTGSYPMAVTTWSTNSGSTSPFGSIVLPNPSIDLAHTGNHEYYAIVQDDYAFSSRRSGRAVLPVPQGTTLPSPEDHGMEGHWWFVDSASPTSISMFERDPSYMEQALDLPVNSSISVRRLTSLADLFQGLRDVNVPHHWLAASDGAPSPFVDGDRIRFLQRSAHQLDWTNLVMTFANTMTSNAGQEADVILKYIDLPGATGGYWVDEASTSTPMPAVQLEHYRLRPDEAIEYIAMPSSVGDDAEAYWTSGFVSTSDVYAYVNAVPLDSASNPISLPMGNTGLVSYAVSTIGWPFPTDCKIATYFLQSSMFFESGMTMKVDSGTANQNYLPPTNTPGAVLFYSDYEDQLFIGDAPENDPTVVWGDYTGDHKYYAPALPFIRTIDKNNNQFTNVNSGVTHNGRFPAGALPEATPLPQERLRAGRGYNVLMNRATADNSRLLHAWRMRRPYRRP